MDQNRLRTPGEKMNNEDYIKALEGANALKEMGFYLEKPLDEIVEMLLKYKENYKIN